MRSNTITSNLFETKHAISLIPIAMATTTVILYCFKLYYKKAYVKLSLHIRLCRTGSNARSQIEDIIANHALDMQQRISTG